MFRGWSRLCLHAASLNAAGAAVATATAAARAARAEAEEREAAAAQAAAGIATDAAVVRRRVEAAETDAKEQRERRAMQLVRVGRGRMIFRFRTTAWGDRHLLLERTAHAQRFSRRTCKTVGGTGTLDGRELSQKESRTHGAGFFVAVYTSTKSYLCHGRFVRTWSRLLTSVSGSTNRPTIFRPSS